MRRDLAPAIAIALALAGAAAQAAAVGAAPRQSGAPAAAPPQTPAPQTTPAPTLTPAPAADEDEVVRITANLVQFDAVVTDGGGRVVADLRPEELRVLVDGKPQEISNFSFVTVVPAAAPGGAATAAAAPAARPDKSAPPLPPVPLRAAQVRRTVALVVDDLGTSFSDLVGVRRALNKFVDEQMQPGDLVAVVQTGRGLGALQQFTTDKQLLRRAIERVRWNPSGRAGVSSFAPVTDDPFEVGSRDSAVRPPQAGSGSGGGNGSIDAVAEQEGYRRGVFTVGTLGALDFVVRGMRELPGRKSVIVFSGGFSIYNDPNDPRDRGDSDRVLENLRRLTDQANRASVVIYTIDARGLVYTGPTAADTFTNPRQEAMDVLQSRSGEVVRNREGLAFLAEQTGGFLVRNSNDLGRGVRRALEDQKGYYLIAFRPPAEVFERTGVQARFNKFEVRVTRPGLRVRTRAGFYGYPEGRAKPVPRTRAGQMLAALTSPLTSGDLNLRLTSLFNSAADGTAVVDSLVHVDASQLRLADEPEGWKRAVFDVVALTFGENGHVVDQINRTETLRVRGDVLRRMLAEGFVYLMKVPVRKPGAYQLRVAVRDAATERLGSASQFIEVPDLKKNRLTLSGIFLTSAPGAQGAGADAPPADAGAAEAAGGPDPLRDAAVRRFRQGDYVDFRYHVYNAKGAREGGAPRLLTQTRVFRDGRAVYESPPQPLDPGPRPNAARLEAGRRLLLGAQLTPGEYVLQVVVTDELAKGKHRTATQWIDFEIVK
ncbi:MAG TPA: VWA domain-containing protein [Pyrinomonadaceae bacterium]|jgi:VWFA-related protein